MIIRIVNIVRAHFLRVNDKLINLNVLVSIIICIALILIAVIRNLSYSSGGWFIQFVNDTPLYLFTYQPQNYINVQFFKVLATPSIIAVLYFLFRSMNDETEISSEFKVNDIWRVINFSSLWFRILLTTVITMCWIPIELLKFYYKENFYPFSELESFPLNMIVLICGQLLSIIFMKYLSFKKLIITEDDIKYTA